MSSKAMSLKGKIKNYAKNNNVAAQLVLQNYMFECFLVRLSVSEYSDKFIIKSGMLIIAIVGLDTRTTMDLDATLRKLLLTEEQVTKAMNEICAIDAGDEVYFYLKSIAPIRKDDIYGGFRVKLEAVYDTIITPLSIDVSTGDVITPDAVKYEFSGIFDENIKINLWGYNLETVMAEKIETILSRGIFNTRPRDFYDIYILGKTQKIDSEVFRIALKATAEHRGSFEKISDVDGIIEEITKSDELRERWKKYQKSFAYASDISYDSIIDVLKSIIE